MTLSQDFIAALSGDISAEDLKRAALVLLDWTGCAVAGKAVLEPDFLSGFSANTGPCFRIGESASDVKSAAFHNGCLGNVLEMDDVDRQAILHPGPTVIPAALSVAASLTDVTAEELLSAIVIGYEATIRIGRAAGAGHYALWHSTGTCGVFGAAAAASHLLKADTEQALNLAGTLSAGLWQTRHDPHSHAKQIHTGHAAQTGVHCAQLAKAGARGPSGIFDGPQGFFAAMCPGADPYIIAKAYGDVRLIHETSLKPYPACRHAHPAIDAALLAKGARGDIAVKEGNSIDGDILIETYDDAIKFCDKPDPKTAIEAKFSLQHSLAHTLLFGAPGLSDFSSEALEKTAKLRERITVKSHDAFNRAYPAHFGAAVTLGGARYVARDAYGDPENPMSLDAAIEKAQRLFVFAGMTEKDAAQLSTAALASAEGGALKTYEKALP